MPSTCLSDLPTEILSNIVHWLAQKDEDWFDARPAYAYLGSRPETNYQCLYPLLLVNKKLCSVVVKRLYQHFYRFIESDEDECEDPCSEWQRETLLSSITSKSSSGTPQKYFPYYQYVQRLEVLSSGELHVPQEALIDEMMRRGQLTKLDLICVLPKISPRSNLTRIKSLNFRIVDSKGWKRVRTYLKNLASRCVHLETLDISASPSTILETLSLPTNNLKSLIVEKFKSLSSDTTFTRIFLAPHSPTLQSISLKSINFSLNTSATITFPNLTCLGLYGCQLEGWETLFKSLTLLKHLALDETELVGIDSGDLLAQVPKQTLRRLETLRLCYPDVSWLEPHFTHLSSLRKLAIYSLSPSSLSSLLKHCQNLESLYFVPDSGMLFGLLSCAHLEVFSRVPSPSLKKLTLRNGSFYPESIISFAAGCLSSLGVLKVSNSTGINAESLRALLRLSLSQLTIIGQKIHPKEHQKVEDIIKKEKHEGLGRVRYETHCSDWEATHW